MNHFPHCQPHQLPTIDPPNGDYLVDLGQCDLPLRVLAFSTSLRLYEGDSKRIEGILKQLGKLQSALGTLTDMASARTILSRIAEKAKAVLKSVKLKVTGDQEKQKSKQLKKAARSLEKLENLKPFWT